MKTVGITLLLASCVFWVLALVVTPLLPLSLHIKAGLAAGLYVVREILFYLSLYILGKGYLTWVFRRSAFIRNVAKFIRSIFKKPAKEQK